MSSGASTAESFIPNKPFLQSGQTTNRTSGWTPVEIGNYIASYTPNSSTAMAGSSWGLKALRPDRKNWCGMLVVPALKINQLTPRPRGGMSPTYDRMH